MYQRLYERAIVIDMHNDMPTKVLDDGYDPDVRHAPGVGRDVGHTDLPRLVESGITAVFLVAWVDAVYTHHTPDGSFARASAAVDAVHRFVARHPDRLLGATTADDVRRAKASGRIAVFLAVEGGHAIEGSVDCLRAFYERGVRYLTLTWNNGNAWAGSSIGIEGTRTEGLTAFGREVIGEMNRLGMLVDVSHASDATVADVLATSTAPVIASHSSARALADHPRNLTDAQLRAIADAGGVINVNFYSRFIDPVYRAAVDAGATELPVTPLSVLIDHIDHVATVAGLEHVGLGSDFDGMSALPEGVPDVTGLPRIADALLARGYAERDVEGILGGNMLRLLDRVLTIPSRRPM
ncbi:MAG TPA: dipeptidase [Gemmatimonadaceae bacterium]|nr:dipeptidase [Gemmatimonadaceae bacterium]